MKATEAGFHGESYVDNFLKQVHFPKNYAILKDLHIQVDPSSFLQIDTLILTRKYIALLEIKNIRGKIAFQKNPEQLIREFDGEITPFKCPELQITRQTKKLQSLLQELKINLPIKKLIVLAYSNTHVVLPPKYTTIVMGCDISIYIDDYNQLPDVISTAKFNQLCRWLVSRSFEFTPIPLAEIYPVNLSDVITGLICPTCWKRIKGQTKCLICKTPKLVMQQQALEDWFYLMKSSITNSECVHFLGLKDKHAGNYLLNKLPLQPVNNHKSRHYVLSLDDR
ncbi:Nuclease-related domain-containing protein [Psychrobacillus sp. OK028]|uniref:nuclease-related domain-containing protein n=1 Tax=Psychrobacillus sp. OK028 TaxID=1884359 RepID=UPI00088A1AC0|nr:nuclease-related domain-containing protein [Psychrobacillus sp. OK028]SDN64730.1 Nuclease-related domain-containing protein [Psychrobacillus sp. OK028]